MNQGDYIQSVNWLLERAKTDFLSYVLLFHPQDGSRGRFILSDFHKFLIAMVQNVVDGNLGKRQAVSVPPQHGKSSILSIEAPSWLLGRFPDKQIAITGYSYNLTTDFSRAIRDRVEEDLYQMIFPDVRLTKAHAQVNNWRATNGSGVVARSVRSKLTGRKVDWLIIDDPHAGRDEAESLTMREKVHRWYFGDCISRLSPDASVFFIGCLTGNTAVSMWDGSRRRIDSLKVGDELAQFLDGKRVKAVVENWIDHAPDTVYEIKTGNSCVRANARHPWLVDRKGKLEWVRTDRLEKGDDIVCSRYEHFDTEARLTSEEAWAVGFMLGDGWVTVNNLKNKKRNGTISRTTSYATCFAAGEHPDIDNRMLDFIEGMFGTRPKLTKFGYYRTNVAKVGRYFLYNGIKGGAKRKRVEPWIFGQPYHVRRSVLNGFVDADGCYYEKHKRFYAYSCNDDLIQDIRNLVRSCGLNPANIHRRSRVIHPPHSKTPVVSNESSFGWQGNRTVKAFSTSKIRTVTLLDKPEKVYDIQVSGEQSFIADGLVSHNTRFHPHDLIGKITDVDYEDELRLHNAASEIFQVTNLPAICETDDDPLGREIGEALFPQVRNHVFLNAVRASIPSYEWESQYMGRPRSARTNMIDVDKIEMIELEEVPPGIMLTRGWDTALTEKQTSDWSVGAKCGILFPASEEVIERKKAGLPPPLPTFYIIDICREKLNWPKLKAKMNAVAIADLNNDNIGRIGMEAVAGFEAAFMEIRSLLLGKVTVERRNPMSRGGRVMDKLMRAQAWLNLVEAGNVKMVRGKWNKDLISEMEVFPEGEFDDQIDSLTISYEVFTAGRLLLA